LGAAPVGGRDAAFLAFSDAEWERWPAGPYLVVSRENGRLLPVDGKVRRAARAGQQVVEGETASGPQDARDFPIQRGLVGDVHLDMLRPCEVEGGVLERHF
jgi:hypothetical protein